MQKRPCWRFLIGGGWAIAGCFWAEHKLEWWHRTLLAIIRLSMFLYFPWSHNHTVRFCLGVLDRKNGWNPIVFVGYYWVPLSILFKNSHFQEMVRHRRVQLCKMGKGHGPHPLVRSHANLPHGGAKTSNWESKLWPSPLKFSTYSAFRKYSHPLTFSTFCCYSLHL